MLGSLGGSSSLEGVAPCYILFIDKLPPQQEPDYFQPPGSCEAPGIPRKSGDQGDNNRGSSFRWFGMGLKGGGVGLGVAQELKQKEVGA